MEFHQRIRTSLSIVMPVHNEEAVIENVVRDFYNDVLAKFELPEFIIIDDASIDSTPEILARLAAELPDLRIFTNRPNIGHGPSVLKGYRIASCNYVFHTDSDNQYVAGDFWKLWDKMQKENLDVVMSWRIVRRDVWYRRAISHILEWILWTLFGWRIPDSNAPFKLHTRKALERVLTLVPRDSFMPSIFMALGAHHFSLAVRSVPITHRARTTGQSFIRSWKIVPVCYRALAEIIAFRKALRNQ